MLKKSSGLKRVKTTTAYCKVSINNGFITNWYTWNKNKQWL